MLKYKNRITPNIYTLEKILITQKKKHTNRLIRVNRLSALWLLQNTKIDQPSFKVLFETAWSLVHKKWTINLFRCSLNEFKNQRYITSSTSKYSLFRKVSQSSIQKTQLNFFNPYTDLFSSNIHLIGKPFDRNTAYFFHPKKKQGQVWSTKYGFQRKQKNWKTYFLKDLQNRFTFTSSHVTQKKTKKLITTQRLVGGALLVPTKLYHRPYFFTNKEKRKTKKNLLLNRFALSFLNSTISLFRAIKRIRKKKNWRYAKKISWRKLTLKGFQSLNKSLNQNWVSNSYKNRIVGANLTRLNTDNFSDITISSNRFFIQTLKLITLNPSLIKNSNYLHTNQETPSFAQSLPLKPTSFILKSKFKSSFNFLKLRTLKNMYRKKFIKRAVRKKIKRIKVGSRIKIKIIRRYRRFKKAVIAKKNYMRLKRIKEANEKRIKSKTKFKLTKQSVKLNLRKRKVVRGINMRMWKISKKVKTQYKQKVSKVRRINNRLKIRFMLGRRFRRGRTRKKKFYSWRRRRKLTKWKRSRGIRLLLKKGKHVFNFSKRLPLCLNSNWRSRRWRRTTFRYKTLRYGNKKVLYGLNLFQTLHRSKYFSLKRQTLFKANQLSYWKNKKFDKKMYWKKLKKRKRRLVKKKIFFNKFFATFYKNNFSVSKLFCIKPTRIALVKTFSAPKLLPKLLNSFLVVPKLNKLPNFLLDLKKATKKNRLYSKYRLNFIFPLYGFLFITSNKLTLGQLTTNILSNKKASHSFFYFHEFKAFVAQINNKAVNNYKSFFSIRHQDYRSSVESSSPQFTNMSTADFLVKNSFTQFGKVFGDKPVEPIQDSPRVPQINFKRQYMRMWRNARVGIKAYFQIKFQYQHRLTRFLPQFYNINRLSLIKSTEMKLKNLLLFAHLVPDWKTSDQFIHSGFVFLNGRMAVLGHTFTVRNDLVQVLISMKYYVLFKWMTNWERVKSSRLNRLLYLSRQPTKRRTKKELPDWVVGRISYPYDIPKYVEVDYLTLSVFVLYEPYLPSDFTHMFQKFSRSLIYNTYNWKYLT